MTKKLIVSRSSLQSLADKHDLHASQKRTAQREAKVAKEWGDLSENAEYKASKEKFRLAGRIQQRLVRELKKLEDTGYEVVDPLDWVRGGSGGGRVEGGTVARVLQAGVAEDYLVVGEGSESAAGPSRPSAALHFALGAGPLRLGCPAVGGGCYCRGASGFVPRKRPTAGNGGGAGPLPGAHSPKELSAAPRTQDARRVDSGRQQERKGRACAPRYRTTWKAPCRWLP